MSGPATQQFVRDKEGLTPEGLTEVRLPADDGSVLVREIGKLGYVVYEWRQVYNPEADFHELRQEPRFLIEKMADLKERCACLERISRDSTELKHCEWNRKKAGSRLRRWVAEHPGDDLVLPEPHLREAANEALKEGTPQLPDDEFDEDREFMDRLLDIGPFVIAERPPILAAFLNEMKAAFGHGLFRGSIALCRVVVEGLLDEVRIARQINVRPLRRNEGWLEVLIDCISEDLLSEREREFAHRVRQLGNDAMHNPEMELTDEVVLEAIVLTKRVAETLINNGGLKPR